VQRIPDVLAKRRTLSFEYFPPPPGPAREAALRSAARLAHRRPDFVSVTYGAGGSDRARTRQMVADVAASHVSARHRCPVMPHLTGIGHTKAEVRALLADHQAVGVANVLALAGDPRPEETVAGGFRYATDLVTFIQEETDVAVGVAAFPEVHPRSPDRATDRRHLAHKLSLADFAITQFFFDEKVYAQLIDELAALGCTTPVIPGVIPVTNPSSVKRFAEMNNSAIPVDLWNRLEAAEPKERLRIAVDEAAAMVANLVDLGAPGVHLYSLNSAEAVEGVLDLHGDDLSSSE